MYECTYIHVCMYACTCTYIYVCMHVCIIIRLLGLGKSFECCSFTVDSNLNSPFKALLPCTL